MIATAIDFSDVLFICEPNQRLVVTSLASGKFHKIDYTNNINDLANVCATRHFCNSALRDVEDLSKQFKSLSVLAIMNGRTARPNDFARFRENGGISFLAVEHGAEPALFLGEHVIASSLRRSCE